MARLAHNACPFFDTRPWPTWFVENAPGGVCLLFPNWSMPVLFHSVSPVKGTKNRIMEPYSAVPVECVRLARIAAYCRTKTTGHLDTSEMIAKH